MWCFYIFAVNSIDIASFFRNSPETSKLLAMIQDAPEILHVLLVSLSTEKVSPSDILVCPGSTFGGMS